MLVLVFAVTISVQAGPPEEVSGTWLYTPHIMGAKEAGCNLHLTTTEDSFWEGTFDGTSIEDGRAIIHCAGNWSFKATVYFDDVKVNGRSGTLEMTVNGSRPNATAD